MEQTHHNQRGTKADYLGVCRLLNKHISDAIEESEMTQVDFLKSKNIKLTSFRRIKCAAEGDTESAFYKMSRLSSKMIKFVGTQLGLDIYDVDEFMIKPSNERN